MIVSSYILLQPQIYRSSVATGEDVTGVPVAGVTLAGWKVAPLVNQASEAFEPDDQPSNTQ